MWKSPVMWVNANKASAIGKSHTETHASLEEKKNNKGNTSVEYTPHCQPRVVHICSVANLKEVNIYCK